MPEIKFCGLTRPEDAELAERLGASYLGVIFAGGPRNLSIARAAEVLAGRKRARRVGVFGVTDPVYISEVAHELSLHVVQMHTDTGAAEVKRVRTATGLEVWPVIRIGSAGLPPNSHDILAAADAVVLDTHVRGVLGGSGKTFDWASTARSLRSVRGRTRLVLAGGLTPENVAEGISALQPDVVDVSSGVESAPGIKNPDRMREFAEAVRGPAVVSP